jgi:hydroxylamine dehydrogenase
MMKKICGTTIFLLVLVAAICFKPAVAKEENECVKCHKDISPGLVADWQSSKHYEQGITCSDCHGTAHQTAEDADRVILSDESVCAECHEEQFGQFRKGKHNLGWKSMNALQVTHVEPDELIEGGRGCGGCNNMGIKSKAEKMDLKEKGYRYQNNSCDE